MDIDALLDQILTLSRTPVMDYDKAEELAQAIENLDAWLSTGGFLPERWRSQ